MPMEALSSRVLSLGYNGVVSTHACKGVAWIKRVSSFEELTGKSDYFLWQSHWKEDLFFEKPECERWTRAEMIAREMEQVEKKIPKGSHLIFLLPGEERLEWIAHLAKCAGPKTVLAFSPYCGEATEDFLPPQSIWRKIAEGEEFCGTPLLPLLNAGMCGLGGGLWPTLPFDLYDRFYGRLNSYPFRGAITLTPTIPSGKGFLHCALWVGSRILQKEESPEKPIGEWFIRFKEGLDYFSSALLLRNLRTLALETAVLRHLKAKKIGAEESRTLLDGLGSKIQALHYAIEREQPLLLDPFLFFARDVRRHMCHFAFQNNVGYSPHADEALESFWSSKSGTQVQFFAEPSSGKPGSKQESLFAECWG